MDKHRVAEEHAAKFLDWLRNRGGVAVWDSIDLSDPTFSLSTPALAENGEPFARPHWKVGEKPVRVITDIDEIKVATYREVKRFHVATRVGSQGVMAKVTEGGSRRIEREVTKAGEGARYTFDYFDYENAVILAPSKVVPLKEWKNEER